MFKLPYRRLVDTPLSERNFAEIEEELTRLGTLVTDLQSRTPLPIFAGDTNVNKGASLSWTDWYDGTGLAVAPTDGVLVVNLSGRAGFNSSAVDVDTRLSADNGDTRGSSQSYCTTQAPAAQFEACAVSAAHAYTAGETLGFLVSMQSNIATGSNYLRAHVTATFFPLPA